MFHLIPHGTNFDFVGKKNVWIGLSILSIIGSFALMATKGLNYGIDFSGGAEIQLKAPKDWDIGKLRDTLSKGEVKGLRVQEIGEPEDNEYLVRAQGDEGSLNQVSNQVRDILTKASSADAFEIKRADVVGPAAGESLRNQGLTAMFFVLVVILVYVAVRFDARYAPGAVLALFHDTVITLGILALLGKQFDLTILGALLALIGYSNNDTIIVFDRVRETAYMHPEFTIEKNVNLAVNETLNRTIVTSFMTFIVALALWVFGGPVLEGFAFVFLIGIVIGSYSSIFIASTLVVVLTNYSKRKKLTNQPGKKKRREYMVRAEPS